MGIAAIFMRQATESLIVMNGKIKKTETRKQKRSKIN